MFPSHLRQITGIKLEKYDLVSYWWFFGFNDGLSGQNHQGDWEHVTVKVKNNAIVCVYFAAHNFKPKGVNYAKLKKDSGRFVVYCAKGSHASYENKGPHLYLPDHTNDGYRWDTSQMLSSLKKQSWRHYAGAWGEVGTSSATTGPLGPWHKRKKR